jgi:hypothetical protein
MRYGEDNYENNFLDDFSGYGGYGGLPATTYTAPVTTYTAPVTTAQPRPTGALNTTSMAQPAASWGTGGLGSYQLSDPSLAATPDWLKNRDPALNRVDWGGNYDPVTGRLGVLPFFVGGSEAQDASYFQGGDTSDMAGYAGMLETGLPTYNISTEFGRPVDNYLKLNPASENPVRIINASEGKITYEGAADPQGLVNALDQATADGNKNIWSVQEKVGDQWVTTHKNEPIGNLVRDYMLPAMLAIAGGAALGPLIGGTQGTLLGAGKLAAAAGTGLGSAAGSFTGNVAAGKPLDEALKAAAITGVTAGVLKGVIPGGGTPGISPGEAAAAKLGYAGGMLNNAGVLTDAAGNLVSTGLGTPAAVLAAGAGDALATVTGQALGNAAAPVIAGGLTGAAPVVLGTGANGPLTTVTGTTDTSPLAGASSTASDAIRFIVDPSTVTGNTPSPTQTVTSTTDTNPAVIAGGPAAGAAPVVLGTGANGPLATVTNTATTNPAVIAGGAAAGATPVVLGTGANGPLVTVTNTPTASTTGGKPADLLAPVADAFTAANVSGVEGKSLEQEQAEKGDKDGVLSKINPVRAGIAGLAGLVRLLAGGGGGGGRGVATGNAGAGTRASLDPIFSAKLPAASPQYSGMSLAPRDMRGVDFARYGYGPGASFFENVPRNPEEYRAALAANTPTARPSGALNLPPMPMPQMEAGTTADPTAAATSLIRTYIPSATDAEITEFLATEEGMQFLANFGAPVRRARGGSMRGSGTSRGSYAVKGAGTGRSDEIPALLSDGEYVMDAETVAMLGDGSSEAGAKRLDDFRINVRKHKGRNLAKGKFSANAKRPEKYLAGGRA